MIAPIDLYRRHCPQWLVITALLHAHRSIVASRPNFLIFVTDQHRADHLGCYGNTVVRTPHIDAIARDGIRFDRAYVANPVCMPNRGSMVTGRMPSAHGSRGNGVPLPLEAVTFADVLAASGYHTALIGKSHLQTMVDSPPALPSALRDPLLTRSEAFPEVTRTDFRHPRYRQELRSSWSNPAHRLELPYYGFQDVLLCNDHADECFGDYSRWLEQNHPAVAQRVGREHGTRDPAYIAPQAWRTQLTEDQYPTHYVAAQSCAWLHEHQRQRAGQPFTLVCSFPDPHHPWTPPGKYWNMYKPEHMTAPGTATPHADAASHVRWLQDERRDGKANTEGPRIFATSERETREIIALTYGMISNVDDRIGMVMQALRDCGADDNTVVVFMSDHGDLMGDHGVMLKGPLHYQGLIRVPFLWRDTAAAQRGAAPSRSDLVSSIDLCASVLQRAGIAVPDGNQGKALVGPTGQHKPSGRHAVLIEESQQRAYLGFREPVQVRTIVSERYRLSMFHEGTWGELYDLQADPNETRNLWDEPSCTALRCGLLDRMVRLLIEHADMSPRPTSLA